MDFIAIDFETANEKRNSPCSMGIVVVKENKIIEEKHILIKPKDFRFNPMNIWIHGIRPEQVENEKEFNELWPEIQHYFDESMIIAHNASFDISVLRKTLESYNITLPSFNYICTMKMAKNFYTDLKNAKLNTVNNFLGYKFNHHDALDDARACANILFNIQNELNMDTINEIAVTLGIEIGEVTRESYFPCSCKNKAYVISNRKHCIEEEKILINNNSYSFSNEVVVFTGGLQSMTRGEAMCLVRKLGGNTGSSVTKKTTCLVTSIRNYHLLSKNEMSNKLRRAIMLKEEGQDITILSEEDFLNKIKSNS